MTVENSSGRLVIYQMMTRLFGNKNTTNKPFGTLDENGVGKFNDINDKALTAIKDLGISHVWYTGVIEHAVLTDYTKYGIALDDADVVKGRAGSPYAIKDYYDVDPDLAIDVPNRMKEFERLIERTHAHGLKAIIDFVPNHVARAYKSDAKPEGVKDLGELDDKTVTFKATNNFYYLPGQSFQVPKGYSPIGKNNTFPTLDGVFQETPAKATGNDKFTANPDINDWFETVKLNYGVDIQNNHAKHFDPVPDTWIKMKDILLFWTGKKVDGFRCDMAEMVPVEFWGWAIPQIKAVNPDVLFIAEIYNPAQYRNYINQGNFDLLYDKVQLYDTLRQLIAGHQSSIDVNHIEHELADINPHMLHFLENHDEQRIASKQFAGDPWKAAPAMVVSATLDRGAVMIYFGQEVGEPGALAEGFSGEDGRTSIFDYCGVPEHQKWMNHGSFNEDSISAEQKQLRMFYSDLLHLVRRSEALSTGSYLDITQPNHEAKNFDNKTLAYLRYSDNEKLLIVASFDPKEQTIKVQIPSSAMTTIGLDPNGTYIARDLLWHEAEVGFDKNVTFELKMKPFSSYIFKIK